MKVIDKSEELGKVELMTEGKDQISGKLQYDNDLSRASFDVAVDVGPSSSSRREATIRSLTGIMQVASDPETMQVLQAMAIMNMEGEGIGDVREFFRKKLVKMGAMKPNDEEAEAMAAAAKQKSSQDLALEGMAEEAQAEATAARAGVLKTVAQVENIKADTVKILADIDMQSTEQAIKISGAMSEELNRGIEQTTKAVNNAPPAQAL